MEEKNRLNELKYIFDNINRWLLFAESKNVLLVGFNGALLKGLFTAIRFNVGENSRWPFFYNCSAAVVLVSLVSGLLSFLPKMWGKNKISQKRIATRPSKIEDAILIFYADLDSYSDANLFLEDFYASYFQEEVSPEQSFPKLEKDLAAEILINSKITVRKNNIFSLALGLTIAGIVLGVVAFVLSLM